MLWERRTAATPDQMVGHSPISPGHQGVHPGYAEYVKIAVILAVLTLIEVGVYYVDALEDVLIPILVGLATLKFALVAMWFMHLKFDSRLFSVTFVGGIILAAAVFIAAWSTLDILAG